MNPPRPRVPDDGSGPDPNWPPPPAEPPAPVPDPEAASLAAERDAVAGWPDRWRLRWGLLANEIDGPGRGTVAAGRRAYLVVSPYVSMRGGEAAWLVDHGPPADGVAGAQAKGRNGAEPARLEFSRR